MSLLVAETVVESTTYDALTNAIEAVVKTHTLIESKKVASEIQVVSTSTTTTTTDTKNNVTTEKETLTSRLIDRPIRPLFVEGFKNEVQVTCTVLSHDLENDPDRPEDAINMSVIVEEIDINGNI